MNKGTGSLGADGIIKMYRSSLEDEEAERERSLASVMLLEAAISNASQPSTLSQRHASIPTRPPKCSYHGRKRIDKSIREKASSLAEQSKNDLPQFSRLHTVNAVSDRAFLERDSEAKLMLKKKAEVVKARFCSRKSYMIDLLTNAASWLVGSEGKRCLF